MGIEGRTEGFKIDLRVSEVINGILPYRDKRVEVILENGFNTSKGIHPLEDYFIKNGITYFFSGKEGRATNEEVYELDLNKINVVYDN